VDRIEGGRTPSFDAPCAKPSKRSRGRPYAAVITPKSKDKLARQHLDTARGDLDAERKGAALSALFYAAEAAIDYLADSHGIDTKKKHWLKAEAAAQLHKQGVLKADFETLLSSLNQERKDFWYEGEEPDLDLEDTYTETEELVEAAEAEAGS
jgi:hypothetical protein